MTIFVHRHGCKLKAGKLQIQPACTDKANCAASPLPLAKDVIEPGLGNFLAKCKVWYKEPLSIMMAKEK